jgi:hypothetical protein
MTYTGLSLQSRIGAALAATSDLGGFVNKVSGIGP